MAENSAEDVRVQPVDGLKSAAKPTPGAVTGVDAVLDISVRTVNVRVI